MNKSFLPHIHYWYLNKWQFNFQVSKCVTVTQLKILGFKMGAFELGVMDFGKF